MTIEKQAAELIRYLSEQLDARCAAQRDKAVEQQRQIVRQAFHLARQKVSRMVTKEREYLRHQTAKAQAHLSTLERQQRQRRMLVLLERTREALRQELVARWQQPAVRQHWLRAILEQARDTLPAGTWEIRYGPQRDDAGKEELMAMLPEAERNRRHFIADPDIEAGIRICTQGTVLDGTVEGLLYDAHAVDARLVAHLENAERRLTVRPERPRASGEKT